MEVVKMEFCAYVKIDKNILRHINQFLGLKCAPDLLEARVFPNGKEITESMGAFRAVWRHLDYNFGDRDVTLVSVGDGNTPRTASLFAFRTAWNCVSIDPRLKKEKWSIKKQTPIDRLIAIQKVVEDVDLHFKKVVIVAVHSHATIEATLAHITGDQRSMVAIPCCVPYEYHIHPNVEYRDEAIWSPMNNVKIWRDI